MGTIAQKGEYLEETKGLIAESINNLGGSITSETTFREYAEELDTIYSNLPKVTGEGTEVTLTPTLKGKLNITEKGNSTQEGTNGYQLIPIMPTTELGGITFSQENTGIKVNGTITASGNYIAQDIFSGSLEAGTYIINGLVGGSSSTYQIVVYNGTSAIKYVTTANTTFTLTETSNIKLKLYLYKAYGTFNNLILPYMLETGSTAHTYEQYTGGIPAPNPNYSFPIKSVTGNNNVVVTNKNLVDNTYFSGKGLNASGVLTSNSTLDTHIAPVIAGQTYTVTTDDSNLVLGYYYEKPTENSVTYDNARHVSANKTFTSAITGWISFRTLANYSTPQLEIGSTATSYEEHKEQTLPLNLGNIELNKIGNYQDYIYKNNDKWYKHEEIEKIASYNGETISTTYMSTTGQLTTGATVYYGKTATDIEITDTTLISQLENIDKVKGYNGTTIITSTFDSNNAQMILSASGLKGE